MATSGTLAEDHTVAQLIRENKQLRKQVMHAEMDSMQQIFYLKSCVLKLR